MLREAFPVDNKKGGRSRPLVKSWYVRLLCGRAAERAVTLVSDEAELGDAARLDDVEDASRQFIAREGFGLELQFGLGHDVAGQIEITHQLRFVERVPVPQDLVGLSQNDLVLDQELISG